VDLELLASLWSKAEPFQTGQLKSRHRRTQLAIECYLAGPRNARAFLSAMSSQEVQALIGVVQRGPPYAAWSLPEKLAKRILPLAPLEPDAFLRWVFLARPASTRGDGPLTLRDIWFEVNRGEETQTLADLRREYIRIASRVRRNQRLGLDPWLGLEEP